MYIVLWPVSYFKYFFIVFFCSQKVTLFFTLISQKVFIFLENVTHYTFADGNQIKNEHNDKCFTEFHLPAF